MTENSRPRLILAGTRVWVSNAYAETLVTLEEDVWGGPGYRTGILVSVDGHKFRTDGRVERFDNAA